MKTLEELKAEYASKETAERDKPTQINELRIIQLLEQIEENTRKV